MTREDAVCPRCGTYTVQDVVKRGVRRCMCGLEFRLKDTMTLARARKKRTKDK